MRVNVWKYVAPASIYLLAFLSFTQSGWLVWTPMLFAWVLIPLTELLLPPDPVNMSEAEEALAKADWRYDYTLYFFVLLQFVALGYFLYAMQEPGLSSWDIAGRICSMGLLCGTFGINIGHELGHRIKPFEQWLAKASLMTSLYMHFFIEHNKGHHKHVATPQDPSSARYNEPVYLFYFRTIVFSYLSAWRIANQDARKAGYVVFGFRNEMIQVHLIQASFVGLIFGLTSTTVLIYFLIAAVIGMLLLETVNYIEHYGLSRQRSASGNYERAMPHHSWNSNHVLGRLMLFELSRHSDHHYLASRKYQILRHHDEAPQLPTGYPGSIILSLVPPLWFWVMNRRIKQLQSPNQPPLTA